MENLAARDERRVDAEERVLRRRADEDDDPILDVAEQHILLRAVEAVDFVEEEDRPLGVLQAIAGAGEDVADFLDADRRCVDGLEGGLGALGDDLSQGRFAGAGRAVEDRAGQPIGVQQAAEELAGAEEVLLTDEFVQRSRPHPHGQGLDAGKGGLALTGE